MIRLTVLVSIVFLKEIERERAPNASLAREQIINQKPSIVLEDYVIEHFQGSSYHKVWRRTVTMSKRNTPDAKKIISTCANDDSKANEYLDC
jgi:hypothetical protein